MFDLKTITAESIPRAIEKAERYRLLNEPAEAESICLDVLRLEPDNQQFVNDLGWPLIESGLLQEALATLERAVVMDPADELARENLRFCNQRITKRRRKKAD